MLQRYPTAYRKLLTNLNEERLGLGVAKKALGTVALHTHLLTKGEISRQRHKCHRLAKTTLVFKICDMNSPTPPIVVRFLRYLKMFTMSNWSPRKGKCKHRLLSVLTNNIAFERWRAHRIATSQSGSNAARSKLTASSLSKVISLAYSKPKLFPGRSSNPPPDRPDKAFWRTCSMAKLKKY